MSTTIEEDGMESLESAVIVAVLILSFLGWKKFIATRSTGDYADFWRDDASRLGLEVVDTGGDDRLEMEGEIGGADVVARMSVRIEKERDDPMERRKKRVCYCDIAVIVELGAPWDRGIELETKDVDEIPDEGGRATDNFDVEGGLRIGTEFPKTIESARLDDELHDEVRSLADGTRAMFVEDGRLQVVRARRDPGRDSRDGMFREVIERVVEVAGGLADNPLALELSGLPRDLPVTLRVHGQEGRQRTLVVVVEVELARGWEGHPQISSKGGDEVVDSQIDFETGFEIEEGSGGADDRRWTDDRIRAQLLELLVTFERVEVRQGRLIVEARRPVGDSEDWIEVADDAVELAGGGAIELNEAVGS